MTFSYTFSILLIHLPRKRSTVFRTKRSVFSTVLLLPEPTSPQVNADLAAAAIARALEADEFVPSAARWVRWAEEGWLNWEMTGSWEGGRAVIPLLPGISFAAVMSQVFFSYNNICALRSISRVSHHSAVADVSVSSDDVSSRKRPRWTGTALGWTSRRRFGDRWVSTDCKNAFVTDC